MPKALDSKSSKKTSLDEVKKFLKENYSCYVLLTCTEPSEKGEMQAQLFYEGDEVLASYLVENAQEIFDRSDMVLKDSC